MKQAPEISISRLAVYLRFLEDYAKEKGPQATINSAQLAHSLDMNPHQIRKDLSYFGKFGERGVGYRVDELQDNINRILGLGKSWGVCICGLGNLGSALFAYKGFRQMRLNIVAIFDDDPDKIGKRISAVKVYSHNKITRIVKKFNIDMAIIAVPAQEAQDTADKLIKAGIRAVLNFAPVNLNIPRHVKLRNVDLAAELINLTYFLSSPK